MSKTTSFRHINSLAIPSMLSGMAEPIISLTDTALVGKAGHVAISAVGLSTSILLVIIWVLASIRSATASMIANNLEDKGKTSAIAGRALLLSAGLGICFLLIGYVLSQQIIRLYGAEGELLEASTSYLKIRLLGLPLILTAYTCFGIFKGHQNTLWAMIITLIGGEINLLLDYLWIPEFGIEGAGYASLVSQAIIFLLAVLFLFRKIPSRPQLFGQKEGSIFELLRVSGDLFIRTASLNLALFFANRIAVSNGEYAISAHTILMNLWLFCSFFIDGYANAGLALVGKLNGEGDTLGIRLLAKKIMFANFLIASVLGLSYWLFGETIAQIFTKEINVLDQISAVLPSFSLSIVLGSVAFTFDGIFIGLGNVRFLRNTLILATGIFIPLLYFLDWQGLGLSAVWVSMVVWVGIRGGVPWWGFENIKSSKD